MISKNVYCVKEEVVVLQRETMLMKVMLDAKEVVVECSLLEYAVGFEEGRLSVGYAIQREKLRENFGSDVVE